MGVLELPDTPNSTQRKQSPPNCWYPCTELQHITTQKNILCIHRVVQH
jgi:hypothetical protein